MSSYRLPKKLREHPSDASFIESIRKDIELRCRFKNLEELLFLGSTARGTYCGRPREFDFFLIYDSEGFDFELLKKQVSTQFQDLNPLIIEKNRGFPYLFLTLFYKNRKIALDLVPCVRDPEKVGPVDNTVLHHKYVCERLNSQVVRNIRMLKWLLKRTGLYGASSEVRGFSGYCCQVLILRYKSIDKIDFTNPILMDPCDPRRNLLASVSSKNLKRANLLSKNGFKPYNKLDNQNCVYYKQNAPLASWSSLEKDPLVRCALWKSGTLFVELKDNFIETKTKYLEKSTQYFSLKPHQELYVLDDAYGKKHKKQLFLEKHREFKILTSKKGMRTFNYFK